MSVWTIEGSMPSDIKVYYKDEFVKNVRSATVELDPHNGFPVLTIRILLANSTIKVVEELRELQIPEGKE